MYNIISVSSPRANNFGGGHCCILSWAVAVLIGWPRIKLEVNEIKKKISPGSNKLKFPFENGSWSLNRHYSGNKHYVQLIGNSKIKKRIQWKGTPSPYLFSLSPGSPGQGGHLRGPSTRTIVNALCFFFKKNLTLYLTDYFVVYIVIY